MNDEILARRALKALSASLLVLACHWPLRAQFHEYQLVGLQAKQPSGITAGPDGAMWFTAELPSAIGRITFSPDPFGGGSFAGVFAYPLSNASSYPMAITSGPDGALWFTEPSNGKIGRITTSGAVTEYATPSGAGGIASGSDGALWFTEPGTNKIGRMTTSGSVTEYATPTPNSGPSQIIEGPDGALWFIEAGTYYTGTYNIGRITTSGSATEYSTNGAESIAAGPDGALWFTEGQKIGRISTSGTITEYAVPTQSQSNLSSITAGPDGGLWFLDSMYHLLGRIDTSGSFSYYYTLPAGSSPQQMAMGPDRALWITERSGAIGRYDPGIVPLTITSISPATVAAGGPAFTLTISGTGFLPTSGVHENYNGDLLVTTYVSGTQLAASIPAGMVSTAGTFGIYVENGSITSNIVPLTVTGGPTITSLNPSSMNAGGSAFTLTVNGTGYAAGAVVNWNFTSLTTTYVSSTQLTAAVPASLIATPGSVGVTVVSGGAVSPSATFTISNPPPSIASLSPSIASAGGPTFTLVVNGMWFAQGVTVNWNGAPLPTTFVNAAVIAAVVDASLITAPGTATVNVTLGGTTSNIATFTISPGYGCLANRQTGLIPANGQAGVITTIAGNGTAGFSGDGGAATFAQMRGPNGLAVDATGNILVADSGNNRIRRVATTGNISTVAGSGNTGFSGDGGPATSASLSVPLGVAVDPLGNLFIADSYNNRVRKVSVTGVITTVAGSGPTCQIGILCGTFSGDGSAATLAGLNFPTDVAVDASGNLLIADTGNNRIRKVSATDGVITTVAGNGPFCGTGSTCGYFSGDGGPATSASLFQPMAVAVDASGNLFIADTDNYRVRKVSTNGIITTVAGTGAMGGDSGDGGPATLAQLSLPTSIAIDASGNLFIADIGGNTVREVFANGKITTVAGNGMNGFGGDGGPAAAASVIPYGVALDRSGNLYIADGYNRIREVFALASPSPITYYINQQVGIGGVTGSVVTDGKTGVLTGADIVDWNLLLNNGQSEFDLLGPLSGANSGAVVGPDLSATPSELLFNFNGGSYVLFQNPGPGSTLCLENNAAQCGFSGKGIVLQVGDQYNPPGAQFTSETGTVVIATTTTSTSPATLLSVTPPAVNLEVVQGAPAVSPSLQIGGSAGTAWQVTAGTSAGGAWLSVSPTAGQVPALITVTVNPAGLTPGVYQGSITIQAPQATPPFITVALTLTVTEANGLTGGIITTFAGSGGIGYNDGGFSGDGGAAIAATLNQPAGVAVDASGNVFIADTLNYRIRKVSPLGVITTIAGGGNPSDGLGDGGLAASAQLAAPAGIAVDASGNLFIADTGHNRIRKVSTSGIITTVAGNGVAANDGGVSGAYSGDGGPATSAQLSQPTGVALDAFGNLFIADYANNRIRMVSTCGIITTVAGSGAVGYNNGGYSGDGGPAILATLSDPTGVAVDPAGNLYVADSDNDVIRKVTPDGVINTIIYAFIGDNGQPAQLQYPYGIALDNNGNLYIADSNNNRVRAISAGGGIVTVAGSGSGFCRGLLSGDGGAATSAQLCYPEGVAVDASGNIFIADTTNNRVRKVSVSASIPSIVPQ